MRTAVAIKRCGRRILGFPINPVCTRQLLATGGSKACSASARERRLGGVSPSLAIRSSHFRVAAASLARQADSASNSRGMAKGGAGRSSGLEALFHVGIACAFQQQLGGANPRQILLGDADAAVGGDLIEH